MFQSFPNPVGISPREVALRAHSRELRAQRLIRSGLYPEQTVTSGNKAGQYVGDRSLHLPKRTSDTRASREEDDGKRRSARRPSCPSENAAEVFP